MNEETFHGRRANITCVIFDADCTVHGTATLKVILVVAIEGSFMNMQNFLTQRKLGKSAAELLKVPSVKLLSDTLHVKLPAATGRTERLRWHQDFPSMPVDRAVYP